MKLREGFLLETTISIPAYLDSPKRFRFAMHYFVRVHSVPYYLIITYYLCLSSHLLLYVMWVGFVPVIRLGIRAWKRAVKEPSRLSLALF